MDIVQFSNGKYALRRWRLGYEYAEIYDLENNNKIDWWNPSINNRDMVSCPSLEELQALIDSYNPEIPKQKAKDLKEERKNKQKVTVITKDVKFGCKNPLIKTPLQ
jgi:hypothetical protein